jgi:uncharacterized protein (DUF2336 family)
MNAMRQTIRDLDRSIDQQSPTRRVDVAHRLTDLLVSCSPVEHEPLLGIFDTVIGRLADGIEERPRAVLAERLATLETPPPHLMRHLAHDVIAVANPVLLKCRILDDDDLISVARNKGVPHMLAISRRPAITSSVTDVLVSTQDHEVLRSVVANSTAQFSRNSLNTLVLQARHDAGIVQQLMLRPDLSDDNRHTVVDYARDIVERRLKGDPTQANDPQQKAVVEQTEQIKQALTRLQRSEAAEGPASYKAPVARNAGVRVAWESNLVALIGNANVPAMLRILAEASGTPLGIVEGIYARRDIDLMLVICRAAGVAWSTAGMAIGAMRAEPLATGEDTRWRLEYERLSVSATQRMIRLIQLREMARG